MSESAADPDEQRARSRDAWESSASHWGDAADRIRDWSMAVSARMVDALALQPGDRVLELAAGPGDTGFMAAELIAPGGHLISSDGAEAMVEVARGRAAAQGIDNVEFRQLELEWIDLPTASVDAVVCRWGIMLVVDPEAAAREIRRVLKPSGRAVFAVWDVAERNPWVTIPHQAMQDLGLIAPPEPDAPSMFGLGADGALQELLEDAGFSDVAVTSVALLRRADTVDEYTDDMLEVSGMLRTAYEAAPGEDRMRVLERIAADTLPFTAEDGSVAVPGSALVATASA